MSYRLSFTSMLYIFGRYRYMIIANNIWYFMLGMSYGMLIVCVITYDKLHIENI